MILTADTNNCSKYYILEEYSCVQIVVGKSVLKTDYITLKQLYWITTIFKKYGSVWAKSTSQKNVCCFSCSRMRNLFAEKFISDFIALGGFQSKHYHAFNVTHCSGLQGGVWHSRNCFYISSRTELSCISWNLRSTAQMQQLIKYRSSTSFQNLGQLQV